LAIEELARRGQCVVDQQIALVVHRLRSINRCVPTTPARLLHPAVAVGRAVDVLMRSAYGRMIVNWLRTKSPPVMQRTLADDLKVGLLVLVGAMLGLLVFGGDAASVLIGGIIGVVLMVVVLNVARWVGRRRNA
jgi:hypothetical protein